MSKAKPGRPQTVPGGMRRVCVQLDGVTISKARRLGAGNLSKGIREAVRKADRPPI